MATTFFSTQRALAQLTPKGLIDSNDVSAVKAAFFDYTPPAASAPLAGDFIELCTLPIGAKVIQVQLEWAAQVSTCQLSVGIASSAAKYRRARLGLSELFHLAGGSLLPAGFGNTERRPAISDRRAEDRRRRHEPRNQVHCPDRS